ncbi:MAG: ABC transporter substrate-binding protein [Clostridia bacterium]|nr:ABC transporter substrate-binding protein [Clostridia bacterium]
MTKRVRRLFLTGMALMLAVCMVLTGCGGSNNTQEKKETASTETKTTDTSTDNSSKPIEIAAFIGRPGQAPTADNRIYKKIKDKLGATFKFDFLVGDLEQKIGVMVAGGDYPDLVSGHQKFVSAKTYIPLEDLIEKHAPNLKKHYEKDWNKIKDPDDGHIYLLPNYGIVKTKQQLTEFMGPAFYIQKAVLKEFGYPKVKTLDEYFDLIKKYKEKYPTIDGQPTIGFEILSHEWRDFCLKNAPQHLIGHPNDGNVVVDPKTGKAEIFADKDYAKRYYQKLNEMNAQGLIDRETFVLTYDQYIQKLSTGRVLGMFDQRWNFGLAQESLHTQKKFERMYVACPVVFDSSIQEWYMDRPLPNLMNGWGISTKCKDPVRVLKVLDALVTEEWQILLQWGEKDIDYTVDDKGRFHKSKEQKAQYLDNAWRLANMAFDLWDISPKIEVTDVLSDGNAANPGNQPEDFYNNLEPYDKEFLGAYGYKTWADFFAPAPENPVFYPAWQILLPDGSPAKVQDKKLDDLALKYLPKVILAKPADFEKAWNEYVGEIRKSDVKSYEDRINEQIQWRIKNWSVK